MSDDYQHGVPWDIKPPFRTAGLYPPVTHIFNFRVRTIPVKVAVRTPDGEKIDEIDVLMPYPEFLINGNHGPIWYAPRDWFHWPADIIHEDGRTEPGKCG